MFETAWQDVRYGFRLLRRSPLFTMIASLSLAIGIGANTTIFSVASALLLRPLPGLADPARLVDIGRTQNGRDFDTASSRSRSAWVTARNRNGSSARRSVATTSGHLARPRCADGC